MIVIVDTNVIIDSIFHNDQDCNEILYREHKKELSFIMTNVMSEELIKTVFCHAQDLRFTLEKFKHPYFVLSRLLRRTVPGNSTTKKRFCEDPKDDMFIQCAIDECIKYIISSDMHLLKIKQEIRNNNSEIIHILRPCDFLKAHDTIRLKLLKEAYDQRSL